MMFTANVFIYIFGLATLIIICLCSDEEETYDNYKLLRIVPINERQLKVLTDFSDPTGKIEVLKRSYGLDDSLDMLVAPDRIQFIQAFARDNDLLLELKHNNYRRSLEESLKPQQPSGRRLLREFDLYSYNSYISILDFQQELASKYPSCVKQEEVGHSFEGRPLRLTKISKTPKAKNPIIFVDAGIHAREWVAPAMALYLMKRVADDCQKGANDSSSMLNGVDWYILPLANPDGYEFSRTRNRMWRKTRSQHVSGCRGVDGNRNYGFKWAVSGISRNPCDPQTYPGPRAFSEVETRIVRDIMLKQNRRIKLYVSLHAYGNYLVYPWGFTGNYLPENWQRLDKLANDVSQSIASAGGEPLQVMSAGKWYAAAGGSDDFAFGAVKIPYAFTMELTDGWEFTYPQELLTQALPPFYEGFKTFQRHIRSEFSTIPTIKF